MAKQFCPRAGAVISGPDCDTKIWQTTLRSDIETCQRCEHGRALIATIVIASRKRSATAVDDAMLTAAGRALPLQPDRLAVGRALRDHDIQHPPVRELDAPRRPGDGVF